MHMCASGTVVYDVCFVPCETMAVKQPFCRFLPWTGYSGELAHRAGLMGSEAGMQANMSSEID